jgi:N utilization substance protein B
VTDSVLRRARITVLEALYESETSDHDAETVYNRRIRDIAEDDPELAAAGPSGFGRGVLRGVLKLRDTIDTHIAGAATQFPVGQLSAVDRNILRLAIWELVTDTSAPAGAIVNEAVELARRYGGESSPGFINGVLRTVSNRVRAGSPPSEPPGREEPSKR